MSQKGTTNKSTSPVILSAHIWLTESGWAIEYIFNVCNLHQLLFQAGSFPNYINILKSHWAAKSLLYYDKVASIIPQKYSNTKKIFDFFIEEMIKNELVELLDSLSVLEKPSQVSKPFIKYINSDEFETRKRKNSFTYIKAGKF